MQSPKVSGRAGKSVCEMVNLEFAFVLVVDADTDTDMRSTAKAQLQLPTYGLACCAFPHQPSAVR